MLNYEEKERRIALEHQDNDFENSDIIDIMEPKSIWDKYHVVDISDNRRPIYGVLTEPMRGDMKPS